MPSFDPEDEGGGGACGLMFQGLLRKERGWTAASFALRVEGGHNMTGKEGARRVDLGHEHSATGSC